MSSIGEYRSLVDILERHAFEACFFATAVADGGLAFSSYVGGLQKNVLLAGVVGRSEN